MTHCHDDHICGLIKFLENDSDLLQYITEVYYNDPRKLEEKYPNIKDHIEEPVLIDNKSENLSADSLNSFTKLLIKSKVNAIPCVFAGDTLEKDNFKISFLSPRSDSLDKFTSWAESNLGQLGRSSDWNVTVSKLSTYRDKIDDSPINASSISFILYYNDKQYLFLADAIAEDVFKSLSDLGYSEENKIKASLVKISHHGSRKNTSKKLLKVIDCLRYIILTNGAVHNHPDKESIAKIIHNNPNACILFNYSHDFDELFNEQDHQDYPDFKYQVLDRSIVE